MTAPAARNDLIAVHLAAAECADSPAAVAFWRAIRRMSQEHGTRSLSLDQLIDRYWRMTQGAGREVAR